MSNVLAIVHLFVVICIDALVRLSIDGQAPLLWGILAVVDFPVSLIYLATSSISFRLIANYVYLPYIVHGVFGTMWWYCIPLVISKIAKLSKANSE